MPDKLTITGKYKGYSVRGYHFNTGVGESVVFGKCDQDLINQFELNNQSSNDKYFIVDFYDVIDKIDPNKEPMKIIFNIRIKP